MKNSSELFEKLVDNISLQLAIFIRDNSSALLRNTLKCCEQPCSFTRSIFNKYHWSIIREISMSETFNFTCPECSKTIQLPTAIVGKRGKCPSCGAAVLIQNQAPSYAETPLPEPVPVSNPQIPVNNPLGAVGASSPPPFAPSSGNVGAAPLNPLGSTPASPFNSLEEIETQGKMKRLFKQQPFPGSLFTYSIEVVRDNISVQAIMDSADYSRVFSNLLLAINMVLVLLVGVASWCLTGDFGLFILVLPMAFVLVLLSYVNNRSLEGIRTIVKDEFTISTTAFFDIVSACYIATIYFSPLLMCLAIYQQDWYTVLGVAGWCILAFYCAVVTINPSSLGFKQAKNATTADDAIGLVAYVVKIFSSAAPYIYLLSNVACIIALIYALSGPFFEDPMTEWATGDDGEYIYNSEGDHVVSEVSAFTLIYVWSRKFIAVGPVISALAFPLVMYLYGLISLAAVYVVKAIVDSARYLKNIQR
jgi:hypothetical protein